MLQLQPLYALLTVEDGAISVARKSQISNELVNEVTACTDSSPSLYLQCRLFDLDTILKSQVCWNTTHPKFEFSQVKNQTNFPMNKLQQNLIIMPLLINFSATANKF